MGFFKDLTFPENEGKFMVFLLGMVVCLVLFSVAAFFYGEQYKTDLCRQQAEMNHLEYRYDTNFGCYVYYNGLWVSINGVQNIRIVP